MFFLKAIAVATVFLIGLIPAIKTEGPGLPSQIPAPSAQETGQPSGTEGEAGIFTITIDLEDGSVTFTDADSAAVDAQTALPGFSGFTAVEPPVRDGPVLDPAGYDPVMGPEYRAVYMAFHIADAAREMRRYPDWTLQPFLDSTQDALTAMGLVWDLGFDSVPTGSEPGEVVVEARITFGPYASVSLFTDSIAYADLPEPSGTAIGAPGSLTVYVDEKLVTFSTDEVLSWLAGAPITHANVVLRPFHDELLPVFVDVF